MTFAAARRFVRSALEPLRHCERNSDHEHGNREVDHPSAAFGMPTQNGAAG
jgi:hypothetical protein